MSLTTILYPPPTERGFDEWTWQHFNHHQAIIQAANVKFGVSLTLNQIYPLNENDISTWLDNHQNMHYQMNQLCNVQSNDLGDVDFKDSKQAAAWFQIHWQEHQGCAGVLGLGT